MSEFMKESIKGCFVAVSFLGGVYLLLFQGLAMKVEADKKIEHISCFELKDVPACVAHDANGNFLWLKSPEGKKLIVIMEDK